MKLYKKHYSNHRKSKSSKSKKVVNRKKRIHTCVICDGIFNEHAELNEHLQIHGDGPFHCRICGKEKSSIKTLKDHIAHHPDKGEQVQCHICSKQMLKKVLEDHMGYHTG